MPAAGVWNTIEWLFLSLCVIGMRSSVGKLALLLWMSLLPFLLFFLFFLGGGGGFPFSRGNMRGSRNLRQGGRGKGVQAQLKEFYFRF